MQFSDYVRVSADADYGDSGGPIYHTTSNPDGEEFCYCIGTLYGGSFDNPVGPAAYKIFDMYDMTFAVNY